MERMMRTKSFQLYSKWREQQNKEILERKTDQNLYEGLSGIQEDEGKTHSVESRLVLLN